MRAILVCLALLTAVPARAADTPARRFGDDRFRVTGSPIASALSADGSRLAVLAGVQNTKVTLQVFDAVTGRPVCRAEVATNGHYEPPGLAFSPDGKYVAASVSNDVHVVWAADTGRLVAKLPLSRESSGVRQFTPDGRLVVTGERATDLYDVPSGKVVATWPTPNITRLSPDAKTFARVNFPDFSVSLGDPVTGAVAGTLPVTMSNKVWGGCGLAFSADGTKLAVVPDRTKLHVWDVESRVMESEAAISASAVDGNDAFYAVRFAPDGRSVVLETKRGDVFRWDAGTLAALPTLDVPWARYVRGVHWSKDGRTMLAVADNGLVNRRDAQTGTLLPAEGYTNRVTFDLTADGTRLVVGDHAGRVDLYDATTGAMIRRVATGRVIGPPLLALAVSPDASRVLVGDTAGCVHLRRTAGGDATSLVDPLPRFEPPLNRFLAWSPDGSAVLVGGGGAVARLAANDGKADWKALAGQRSALSPDGRSVVTVSADLATMLDAATGRTVRSFPVVVPVADTHGDQRIRAVAVDGTGRLAVAVGNDVVAIFDATGRERLRFAVGDLTPPPDFNAWRFGERQRAYTVESVAFTPDGKWLVTGGEDQAVKVWEVATGKLVMRFDGSDSPVHQVAVSPDGRSAFAAGGDGFVVQWDLSPRPTTGKSSDELWTAAADADPAVAVPAAWALAGGSSEFLARKLPPVEAAVANDQVDKWISDLGASAFATREAAGRALAERGRLVGPQLRVAAASSPSAEVRRRAEELLARLDGTYTANELRALRIVQACERAGHGDVLTRWAAGAAGALLTEDAKAALERKR